jgi:hypothetical protein
VLTAVLADRVDVCLDQVGDALLDVVADTAHVLDRLAGGIVDVPVLDDRGDVGALGAAGQSDRPVGVELHLERQPLGAPVAEVEADLTHGFDDLGVDAVGGFRAGRLGANILGSVVLEEGLGHLRAPRVLGSDEQGVLHFILPFTLLARASRRTR